MENRWIKAATILPPTVKVCGKTLLPFCLRHRVALEAVNSPVLNIKLNLTPQDLLFAVRVLSTYDMESTRGGPTLKESYLLALYNHRPAVFLREAIKLINYFNAQALWPRFWEKDSKSSDCGIPWHLSIIAGLTRNGCSLEEAWTMPEAEAVWLHIAHCKANGAKIDVVSEQEWQAMEDYKAAESQNKNNNLNRN